MNNPEYVKINEKKYKLNTDFRVAIKCNEVAMDDEIDDYERALAIIYLLYGEDGINAEKDYESLLKLGVRFLTCGKEVKPEVEEPDMSFTEDMPYIEASFMSDYHIDLENINMHWWKFMKLINGLSNSEIGNCCVLNNVRNLRNYDVSKIKDPKERQKILEAKKAVALKKKNTKKFNDEQLEKMAKFNKLAGIGVIK